MVSSHAYSICESILTRFAVAMTRPKRHLCVIGDSDTISKYVHSFLLTLPTVVTRHGSRKRGIPARPSCFVVCDATHETRARHAL
jgi:hypothetical protein